MSLHTEFTVELPAWLADEADVLAASALPAMDDRMGLALRLADRNWREGNGGPFAAIVVDNATGRLVSVGVNVVLSTGLSGAHAEAMALSLAQRATKRWDLGADGADLELVVNWRPCVMCYGATMWSGIRSLVVAGAGHEVEELTGFDEGPMVADWAEQFERRGIRVRTDVQREAALAVFAEFGDSDAVVYNARGSA
jgi:tRNA(Arg) A34 adenosine deaminase TadA